MISVYDLIQKYKDYDKEDLEDMFIEDVWDYKDVNSQIDVVKSGDEYHWITSDEKTEIMKSALRELDIEARRGEVLAKVADKLEEWRKQHDTKSVDAMVGRLIYLQRISADAFFLLDDEAKMEILHEVKCGNASSLEDAVISWYLNSSMSIDALHGSDYSERYARFAPAVFSAENVFNLANGLDLTEDDAVVILAKAINDSGDACRRLVGQSIKVELQKWEEEHKARDNKTESKAN